MKLRIRGNSIRLRLEQHEIKELTEKGEVIEQLSFSATDSMVYRLTINTNELFNAAFSGNTLHIEVPQGLTNSWAGSDKEGIYHTIHPNTDFELKLSIEKDFQCLHKRPGEDESDLFANPKAND